MIKNNPLRDVITLVENKHGWAQLIESRVSETMTPGFLFFYVNFAFLGKISKKGKGSLTLPPISERPQVAISCPTHANREHGRKIADRGARLGPIHPPPPSRSLKKSLMADRIPIWGGGGRCRSARLPIQAQMITGEEPQGEGNFHALGNAARRDVQQGKWSVDGKAWKTW